MDLNYTNSEGISLNKTLKIIEKNEPITKKDIIVKLKAKKSIDTLLKKLFENDLITKKKEGRNVIFSLKRVDNSETFIEVGNKFEFIKNQFNLKDYYATSKLFRRKDGYEFCSLFNKFKSLCEMNTQYNLNSQNLPFYRTFVISLKENKISLIHMDVDRTVRGQYDVFSFDKQQAESINKFI